MVIFANFSDKIIYRKKMTRRLMSVRVSIFVLKKWNNYNERFENFRK